MKKKQKGGFFGLIPMLLAAKAKQKGGNFKGKNRQRGKKSTSQRGGFGMTALRWGIEDAYKAYKKKKSKKRKQKGGFFLGFGKDMYKAFKKDLSQKGGSANANANLNLNVNPIEVIRYIQELRRSQRN